MEPQPETRASAPPDARDRFKISVRRGAQGRGGEEEAAGVPAEAQQGAGNAPPGAAEEQAGEAVAAPVQIFDQYVANPHIGGLPHPGYVVEASSLAAVSLPSPTYPIHESIPREAVADGKLSTLQLESVLYACQRHLAILPNGFRAGFFIGDGAGVGKGRQIAGIILDNCVRGRRNHLWLSISTDLVLDAKRDLSDIGCHVKV